MSEGQLYDGMVYWQTGRRSWLKREGAGVTMGHSNSGQEYFFRRS